MTPWQPALRHGSSDASPPNDENPQKLGRTARRRSLASRQHDAWNWKSQPDVQYRKRTYAVQARACACACTGCSFSHIPTRRNPTQHSTFPAITATTTAPERQPINLRSPCTPSHHPPCAPSHSSAPPSPLQPALRHRGRRPAGRIAAARGVLKVREWPAAAHRWARAFERLAAAAALKRGHQRRKRIGRKQRTGRPTTGGGAATPRTARPPRRRRWICCIKSDAKLALCVAPPPASPPAPPPAPPVSAAKSAAGSMPPVGGKLISAGDFAGGTCDGGGGGVPCRAATHACRCARTSARRRAQSSAVWPLRPLAVTRAPRDTSSCTTSMGATCTAGPGGQVHHGRSIGIILIKE
eukprot:355041-Chlamydomonas_euryale.AAC.2